MGGLVGRLCPDKMHGRAKNRRWEDGNGRAAQEFERSSSERHSRLPPSSEHASRRLKRLQHFLHSNPAAVPLIVLVLSIAIFGVLVGGKFFIAFTLTLILQQMAIVGIVGAAQTLVILTAGIDLSVGAIMVLSSVVMGKFAFHYGMPALIAILCGLAVGALCGFSTAARCLYEAAALHRDARHLADRHGHELHLFGQRDDPRPGYRRPGAAASAVRRPVSRSAARSSPSASSPWCCWCLVLWYVLNHTAWGRHVYAVGDDPEAAEAFRHPVKKMLLTVYTLVRPHLRPSPAGC